MSIDVNVQNDLVIVTESSEDITVNVSNAAGADGVGVPTGGTTGQVLKKLSNTNYDTYWALDGGGVPYSGATGQVDLGNYDLKVQGLTIGKGNNALVNNTALGHSTLLTATTGNFNTAVGYESLRNTTTGQYNTAVGQSSLFSNTTGSQNTAIGLNALLSNTTGGSNVAVGLDGLQHNTTGSSNTAIGYNAGTHITGGSTPNTTATNSVFIGRDSKANADGQTNQIVIGQNAVGNGSNTATFGNTATTANYFTGSINGGSFVKSGGTSSQFLKADGSVDSTTYIGGSGATGQVAYWNGTNSQTGSNNLFWDAANSRLGIGTNAPTSKLHIIGAGTTSATTPLRISDSSGTLLMQLNDIGHLTLASNQQSKQARIYMTGYNTYPALTISSSSTILSSVDNSDLYFYGNTIRFYNGTGGTEWARFFNTSNLVLQNGGTFDDGGQRLQVMGDAFIKGSGATSATTGLQIQDSFGGNMFRVRNDGRYLIGGNANAPYIQASSNGNPLNSGGNLYFYNFVNAASSGVWTFGGDGSSVTSGFTSGINLDYGFIPLSGTAIFNAFHITSRVNQQFGANGITRGLYVNPTLTAAADWRSIEWSNNSGWGLYGAGTANNYLGGSLGIGTTSPIGKLETFNNSIYIGGALSMYSNTASDESIFYFRRGRGTLASPTTVTNGDTIGSIRFAVQYNSSVGGYNTNAKIDSVVESNGANLCFHTNSGGLANSTIAERMRLTAAGRLLLGTTTESTFLLDVNGTARVSSKITGRAALSNSDLFDDYAIQLNGISTTDTTSRILIECGTLNSTGIGFGARALNATINGFAVGTLISNNSSNSAIGHVVTTTGNSLAIPAFAARTNGQSAGGSVGYVWMDGNTQSYFHSIMHNAELRLYNSGGTIYFINDRTTNNITFGANTNYASAQVAIDSSTKGFLPPRMTTTQKNAIGTPAAGLIVYDTDTNKLCCYNGSTWNDLF
jgi:hypothetical protein